MNPQYIKLTAVRVTIPPQNGRGQAQMMVLQPPVERLLPLPQMFTKNQADGRTEVETPGMVVTYRERFDDVVTAIAQAAQLGNCIALPVNREAIEAATGDIAGIVPALAAQRIRATGISPTVQEAVETAVNGVKAALDAEEEAFKQVAKGEVDAVVSSAMDAIEKALNSEGYVKNGAAVDENDPKWKDFVQTDGESVGAPAYSREPKAGDLRIHSVEEGRFFLESASDHKDEITWHAPQLPFHLLRTFDSRDELIEAVHNAGHGKLLVNA